MSRPSDPPEGPDALLRPTVPAALSALSAPASPASPATATAPQPSRPHAGPTAAAADPLLARIEDAGLNASQPPEQLLFDGWLLRLNPGKAKRARSVNAVAAGRLPLAEKLDACARLYRRHRLPLIYRITPFSQPEGLDAALAERGFVVMDPTRVMVAPLSTAPSLARPSAWLREVDPDAFAAHVGALRGSPAAEIAAHARRLGASPLLASTVRLVAFASGRPLGAGQTVIEGDLAGLYDIVTAEAMRGRGLGTTVTQALLVAAHAKGARTAYLQVDAGNAGARRIYARFGFVDRYAYAYRAAPTLT